METILVTGGAGFIGSNIAEALLTMGWRVVILDDLSTGKMENVLSLGEQGNYKFVKGTILDSGLLASIVSSEKITYISHQAAVSSVSKSIADPVTTMETNVAGTANLFHVASAYGCRRIVYASSSSIYGDTPELPKRESMPFCPQSPYAMSKAANELLGNVYSHLYGTEIVGLRYFSVYGRRQDPGSDYAAVIPKFIAKALANEPLPVDGDGCQTRDFIYIDDVVQANVKALTGSPNHGAVFNIAYGKQTSIIDLAAMILELTDSDSEVVFKPARNGDVRDSVGDIASAAKQLGYSRKFDIKHGLAETIAWFREHVVRRCAA
jgi:nucleoside-diphosphate-sugar epimerase